MISDVLSDAAAEIRKYLADQDVVACYDEAVIIRVQLALTYMDAAREVLDAVQPGDIPGHDAHKDASSVAWTAR